MWNNSIYRISFYPPYLHRVVVLGPPLIEHAVADDESRRVEHLAGQFGRVERRNAVGRVGDDGLLGLRRTDRCGEDDKGDK